MSFDNCRNFVIIKINYYKNLMIESENKNLVYNLQLAGINCTNCEAKIKDKLTKQITSGLIKIVVNVLQQKVSLVVQSEKTLQDCVDMLKTMGYKVVGQPMLIKAGSSSIRTISFVYQITAASQEIQKMLRQLAGVTSVYRFHSGNQIKLTLNYDSNVLKGREIGDIINQKAPNYKTINHRVQSFKSRKSDQVESIKIHRTAFLCCFFVIFNMFLPFTGSWYMQMNKFPSNFGPFTLSTIINLALTVYVLYVYAKPFIIRSYRNYMQNSSMDMETLISLGCVSAFFLFCFFFVRFSIQFMNGTQISGHQIMEMNDALASSAIIVLVVTIGKHFQKQVKNKIQKMTEQIFPQSKLFENMNATWVRLKNRKLMVLDKKQYDISLLQKDDIFQILEGRLLVDAIVLSGTFQAIKSAVDGNDETFTLGKGDRIQSGSIILRCEQGSLLQVENVFEKSVLIQIGTHIKLRQNEQQNSQSGIQAVCKTISKYFVKTVILISLLVMATWFFLLSFKYVTVPRCNVCWIVQRGIGVLVASCPCALGLAVPSVVAIVLNIAIKNGILIRNSGVLEKMKKCKIISFDKTGTLFTRINKIEQSHIFREDLPQKTLWEVVAVVQKQLRHPIAQILYKEAYQRCGVEGTNFGVIINKPSKIGKDGLQAEILLKKQQKQMHVFLGNKNLLVSNNIQVPEFTKTSTGATVLYLALNKTAYMVMIINTHSNLRPQATKVIELLMKKNKKQVHILSGDSKESVQKLGQSLSIPHKFLHPEHSTFMKEEWIRNTQKNLQSADGVGVIMVGDGLNDIPCLQQAAIGMSINAKSELNLNASDVILLSQNLYKIVAFVNLLNRGNQFININLFWAFIYNLTVMPIVAGLFYPYNITISPIWSSIAMSASSILVVGFSHLLSFFTYDENQYQKQQIKNQKSKLHSYKQIQMKEQSTKTASNKFGISQIQTKAYSKFDDQVM